MKRYLIAAMACLAFADQQRPLSSIATDLEKLIAELRSALPAPASTVAVPCDGDLVAAIAASKPGDVLTLAPGCRYVTGEIQLPARTGLVTVTTSAALPNRRVGPADAALMPILASGNIGPVVNGTGAANWKFDGIQFESTSTGHSEILLFEGASKITLDRILIVAGVDGQKRAIRGNGQAITLTRSHIANIIRAGQDSQAFCAWEGAGPYTITDNYLEASGENILFGGSDNYLLGAASNPADILIAGNTLFKPLAWKSQPGTVKNLLELKNATRVVIRDNVFENNWTDAQAGWSIVFTPVNQDGRAPWSVVRDVLFERNLVRGVERGLNLQGRAYQHVTQQSSGIVIRKNVIETSTHCYQIAGEIADLTIEDNVCDNGYSIATIYGGDVKEREDAPTRPALYAVATFAFNRNVARHNDYGIFSSEGFGTAALLANTKAYTFVGNRFVGITRTYPPSTVNIDEAALTAAKAALLKELGR